VNLWRSRGFLADVRVMAVTAEVLFLMMSERTKNHEKSEIDKNRCKSCHFILEIYCHGLI
jgi:hypothetical protein